MPTPLETFMQALQNGHMCEESLKPKKNPHTSARINPPSTQMKCERTLPDSQDHPPVSSLPAHTHTSEVFPNTRAEMKCETKCEGSLTLPEPPLQAGWLVAYRDPQNRLRGGCDEREAGTVQVCRWTGTTWTVLLTHGDMLPLSQIVSVGKTDSRGKVVAAWTVKAHGYDGAGSR